MSAATRQCPDCDTELTHPKLFICHHCWERLPAPLRQGFNLAPSMEDRRAAYRAILEHIRERKANPELFQV